MYLPALLSTLVVVVAALEPRKVPLQRPPVTPIPSNPTSQGCFSAEGEWEDPKGYLPTDPSLGFCVDLLCPKFNATVVAMKGQQCFCGSKYPPKETQVEDSKCNYPCPSFPQEACGGIQGKVKYWSVFNTGVEVDVDYLEPEAQTSTSDDKAPLETVPAEDDKKKDDGKSTNVGGIVAGVVVAVVAIAGSIAGVFFYLRRKRNKEIEEEHRRNAAVNSFIGHKPPSSSGGLSISDTRLDPVMAHRRLSDGSIADNQDYTRRILKVTNA